MFVRNIIFETDFDGCKVKAILKPLTFDDLIEVNGIEDAKDSDNEAAIKLAVMFMPKMEGYIKSMEGLVDSEGAPVTVKDMCENAYFLRLVVQMITKLVNSSTPPQKPAEPSAS